MKKIIILILVLSWQFNLIAQTYTYDDFNRLTKVVYSDNTTLMYSYDKLGNRVGYQVIPGGILVNAKVFLQGPFVVADGTMSDHLRMNGEIPAGEPFTAMGFNHVNGGGESIPNYTSVMALTGDDAITDWIFVELRDQNDPTLILGTRSALLQRDGDIVEVDGVSKVIFSGLPSADYYLVIRHRNHFGVRSANKYGLSGAAGAKIDFTDGSTPTFGTNAQTTVGGTLTLYAGEANNDGQINAVDKNAYWRVQNGQAYDYLIFTADFNLDGAVNAVDKNNYWRVNNSLTEQLD